MSTQDDEVASDVVQADEAGLADAAKSGQQDPLAQAREEAARFREQLLRTAADFDNFRKRSRKEMEDAKRRGKGDALKEFLPVFDNLERAMNHAGEQAEGAALVDGIRIVMKQFEDALERVGVERLLSVGAPFDPSLHEAIQHLASDAHPAGVIVAEVQPGYRMGEVLLRPAMVVVSKGPAAGEAKPS